MSYKLPKNVKKASKLLLLALIEKYGGPSEFARAAKISRQLVNTFKNTGYIPLSRVYGIAKALECSVWELAYPKLLQVFGELAPKFESIVSKAKISPELKKKILNAYTK